MELICEEMNNLSKIINFKYNKNKTNYNVIHLLILKGKKKR